MTTLKHDYNAHAHAAIKAAGLDVKALWPQVTTARKAGTAMEDLLASLGVTQAVAPTAPAKAPKTTKAQERIAHREALVELEAINAHMERQPTKLAYAVAALDNAEHDGRTMPEVAEYHGVSIGALLRHLEEMAPDPAPKRKARKAEEPRPYCAGYVSAGWWDYTGYYARSCNRKARKGSTTCCDAHERTLGYAESRAAQEALHAAHDGDWTTCPCVGCRASSR